MRTLPLYRSPVSFWSLISFSNATLGFWYYILSALSRTLDWPRFFRRTYLVLRPKTGVKASRISTPRLIFPTAHVPKKKPLLILHVQFNIHTLFVHDSYIFMHIHHWNRLNRSCLYLSLPISVIHTVPRPWSQQSQCIQQHLQLRWLQLLVARILVVGWWMGLLQPRNIHL